MSVRQQVDKWCAVMLADKLFVTDKQQMAAARRVLLAGHRQRWAFVQRSYSYLTNVRNGVLFWLL